LLFGDYFFAQQGGLEIGGDSAEIADVALFCLDQLADDMFAGEERLG
jgi:hypothetical protein